MLRELSRSPLPLEAPLTHAEAVLYADEWDLRRHVTVVRGESVTTDGVAFTSEIPWEHTPESPAEDPVNHERVLAWLVRRVALDVAKKMGG